MLAVHVVHGLPLFFTEVNGMDVYEVGLVEFANSFESYPLWHRPKEVSQLIPISKDADLFNLNANDYNPSQDKTDKVIPAPTILSLLP